MRLFIKRVHHLIKPYLPSEIVGFILTIFFTISVFASPIVSQYLIDKVIPTKSKNDLYIGLIIFFSVSMAQPIFGFLKDMLFMKITEKISFNIRKRLFHKVISAQMKFFDKNTKGEILSRIINDGRSVSQIITSIFVILVKNIIMIIMILCGMTYISLKLTLVVLITFSVFFFINIKVGKNFNELSLKQQKNFDTICTSINQMTESIVTIKSFLIEKDVEEQFENILKKSYDDNIKMGKLNIAVGNLNSMIVILSLSIIYGAGALMIMNGETTLGSVIALGLYAQLLMSPIYELLNNNIEINKTIPIFDRLYEYLNLEDEVNNNCNQPDIKSEIKIENLSFFYEEGQMVLNNINMDFPKTGMVALIGPSGAGKSTLIKLLMGFYKPFNGKISIGDVGINDLNVNVLRKQISFVPQEVDLLNLSIKENIICAKRNASEEEVQNICKAIGIHEKIINLPEGYETIINERVNLSGGEKQRIGIARALIKNPLIFIFDEPTSSLDPINEEKIKELLEEISKDRLVIVIAHKMTTISNADKIYVLQDGKVVESGNNELLIKENRFYYDFINNNLKLEQYKESM